MKLSILDLSPIPSGSTASEALQNTLELAQLADRLGYERYWLAEHHNTAAIASVAPEIMIGQVARVTRRIRVGAGGIMLPNHSPLKVAEMFLTLEALFPGRIDLGIGRAPGTDPVTARALRRTASAGAEDFPRQLADLFHFSRGDFPEGHPFRGVQATPPGVPLPPVWLLGSSDYSARLAARLGLAYSFAAHVSPYDPVLPMRLYRAQFRPSKHRAEPHAILAVSAICAETRAEAERLARTLDLFWLQIRRGERRPLPSPEEAEAYPWTAEEWAAVQEHRQLLFVGEPDEVAAGIRSLALATQADEVMVTSHIHSHRQRLRSYELLAEAFGLKS